MDDFEPQSRRRKGSLRKTVLLGVERLRLDRRPSTDDSPSSPTSPPKSPPKKHLKSPTKFAFELPSANSSTESHDLTPTPTPGQLDTASTVESEPGAGAPTATATTTSTTSPTSPTGAYTTATTTDDDDAPLHIPPASLNHTLLAPMPLRPSASPSPPSSDTSSVLAPTSPPRARLRAASSTAKKALEAQAALDGGVAAAMNTSPPLPPLEEEWDYAETAWWGWVILIVTWVVFVVGMGSCLEVWSWAWDVGQTPYAPPELEDDPTLPIVGYYPALFVLTGVMSWVWVMVAWVGLKYFKHAKIQGEDT